MLSARESRLRLCKLLRGKLVAGLVGMLLGGCANIDTAALTNCDVSGEARFVGIPLASRTEHQQALRFVPLNPNNCLVYVVREHDGWTGASVRRATVLLTSLQSGHLPFPAKPSDLPVVFGNRALPIYDQVFALWEAAPGSYVLEAFFNSNYGGVYYGSAAAKPVEGSLARTEWECQSGAVKFFAVGDRGYTHAPFFKVIAREEGEQRVRTSVRSVGLLYPNGPMRQREIYNDCPTQARH